MIAVEGLRHAYRRGATPSLDGLDFEVAAGEVFGLLGPNGAGKTTAVKILTTILKPTAGRATVGGHDVVRHPLEARRQLTAVLQESAVEPLLSVRDNLRVYGLLHGLAGAALARRLAAAVEMLELSDQLDKRAQTLSGGFKRRLQVAKAFMVETPVLFLDEATTGMDPLIKQRVMGAIREAVAGGRTVLLTTQLLDEAEALCDRMLLLDRGKARAVGRLRELRELAGRRFEIRLAFAQPGEGLAALSELAPRHLEERDGEIVLTVAGNEDEWIRHMARISERWPLAHLEMRGASLEQIFLELYGRAEETPS
ncbi:MAG: ATP-binding cassette domain-containing protein [Thermoanaerobaculia bacterium]